MLGKVEVLLSHEYTLAEEVLVDLLAVSFGDKPSRGSVSGASRRRICSLTLLRVPGALRGIAHNAEVSWMVVERGCELQRPNKVSLPENVRLKSWQNLNSAKPTNSQA